MNKLRNNLLRIALTILVGLTFLNLSFVSAEIALLKLDKTNALVQSLTQSGMEEEETGSGADGDDEATREIDISFVHYQLSHEITCVAIEQCNKTVSNFSTLPGFAEAFFTPPDRS
jgi:hypothetical protein